MRKLPTPWQWKARGNDWYVTLSRKQVYLAPSDADPDDVQRLAALAIARSRTPEADADPAFHVLANLYLDRQTNPTTYKMRRRYLDSFAKFLAARGEHGLPASAIRPPHVSDWWAENPTWGPGARRIAHSCVNGMCNWAVAEGRLTYNPLAGRIRLPRVVRRGDASRLSDEVFTALLNACTQAAHRELLTVLHQSGMRPGELVGITAADIEDGFVWVSGKTGRRAVGMSKQLAEVCAAAAKRNPTGPLFLNSYGQPWGPNSIPAVLRLLRRRLERQGIAIPRTAIPYAFRHSYATRLLADGHPGDLVAKQLGHSPAMLHKHYSHLRIADVLPILRDIRPIGDSAPKAVDAADADGVA